MAIVLVGGGARSGKSRYALELATRRGGRLAFIATAEALDDEMARRIALHKVGRGSKFQTIEAPLELAHAVRSTTCDAIVVDCLTLWLSNVMLAESRSIEADMDAMFQAVREQSALVILVTNEVGSGIVPDNALARAFQDHSGAMNQRFASAAHEVYWMVFGQPLRIK
jgi:adenosylcobinamide kinase/adenosylcobinamide-phosphate guanylyltransferase